MRKSLHHLTKWFYLFAISFYLRQQWAWTEPEILSRLFNYRLFQISGIKFRFAPQIELLMINTNTQIKEMGKLKILCKVFKVVPLIESCSYLVIVFLQWVDRFSNYKFI